MQIGKLNLITDVEGIKVGNAQNYDLQSGVTVLVPDEACVAAVDIRGGAPGARETALLDPTCTIDRVHAITLSGGSAWGLNAADGVMKGLKSQGRGIKWQDAIIPIVPTSIVFDLLNGGNKNWGDVNPYQMLGEQALLQASLNFELGNYGAGTGTKAGGIKGGLGSASFVYKNRFTVGALVVANPIGSVLMPNSKVFWAWPFEQNGEFGNQKPSSDLQKYALDFPFNFMGDVDIQKNNEGAALIQNTTLAIIATDLILTKAQAMRIAMAAQDGLARAIRPVHTPLDGDTVYVLSTGLKTMEDPLMDMAKLAMLGADCLSRAIARSVYHAKSLGNWTSYQDKYQ